MNVKPQDILTSKPTQTTHNTTNNIILCWFGKHTRLLNLQKELNLAKDTITTNYAIIHTETKTGPIQGIDGTYPVTNNEEDGLAKITYTEHGPTFFIRTSNGDLINPLERTNTSTNIQRHIIGTYKYSRVDPQTFLFYINFLKTHNRSWLYNAERSL